MPWLVLDDHVAIRELEPILELTDKDIGALGVDWSGGRDRPALRVRVSLDQHELLGLRCRRGVLTSGRVDGRRAQQRSCKQDGCEHANARSGHVSPPLLVNCGSLLLNHENARPSVFTGGASVFSGCHRGYLSRRGATCQPAVTDSQSWSPGFGRYASVQRVSTPPQVAQPVATPPVAATSHPQRPAPAARRAPASLLASAATRGGAPALDRARPPSPSIDVDARWATARTATAASAAGTRSQQLSVTRTSSKYAPWRRLHIAVHVSLLRSRPWTQ